MIFELVICSTNTKVKNDLQFENKMRAEHVVKKLVPYFFEISTTKLIN